MAVYHDYTQCYVAPPSAYEQSLLLLQREKELFELLEKINLQEKALAEKNEEIRLLKTKNENLLKAYNKRQANYSMALKVTKAKNDADSQELGELRAENKKLREQLQSQVEVQVKDIENTKLVRGTFTLADIEGARGKATRRIPTSAENGSKSDNLVRGTFTMVEIEALSIIDKASKIKVSSLLHAKDGSKPFASSLNDGTKAVEQADIKPLADAIGDEETEKIDDEIVTSWADIEPESQACNIPEWANVDIANVRAAAYTETTINESVQATNTFAVAETCAPVDATRLLAAEDTDKAINFSTRPTNTCAVADCLDPLDAPLNQAKFFHGVYNVWDIEAGVLVRAHC